MTGQDVIKGLKVFERQDIPSIYAQQSVRYHLRQTCRYCGENVYEAPDGTTFLLRAVGKDWAQVFIAV